jgi:hypothetical protein
MGQIAVGLEEETVPGYVRASAFDADGQCGGVVRAL